MGEPLLQVEELTVRYRTRGGRITALDRVSFTVEKGLALALVGESGSGKSTAALAVLDLLAGEAELAEGRIKFLGQDILALAPRQRRALRGDRISAVFQDPFTSLNPALTVGLQVAEPLIEHRGRSKAAALEEAVQLLHEVGIPRPEQVARSYPHQLSGGMQQRALIATALACDPALVLMDEPTTALDVTIEAQILDLLRDLQRRRHLGVLFITHNLGVVNHLCDAVCVLYAGRVLEYGTTDEILARPRHPYTMGLLASLPRMSPDRRAHGLPAIPGGFPDLARLPRGCVFRPRCPFAEERCRDDQPLVALGGARTSRCCRAAELAAASWPAPAEQGSGPAAPPAGAGEPIVRVCDLRKTYPLGGLLEAVRLEWTGAGPRLRFARPGVTAVDGVSLAIADGEVLGLVGESGCGKSTLGRCVVRLLDPTGGRIVVDGADVTHTPERSLHGLRKKAQIVFQNPDSSLNPRKTVGRIIGRTLTLFEKRPGRERKRRVRELLEMVGLSGAFAERYPHQLSGGEKQRVGIARALASSPRFIVCDEAVSALDVSVQATILNLLAGLRDRLGLSYLFIAHDLSVVAHLADRIAVMYAGALAEEGATRQVLEPPYHPYTEALLSAVPLADPRSRDGKRVRLKTSAEAGVAAASGCRFHHRCPRKLGAICEQAEPPMVEAAPGHRIACHIPLEELRRVPSAIAPALPHSEEPPTVSKGGRRVRRA